MAFIPLIEVDAERQMVFARLDETPDSHGHIMDYTTSKPNFLAWSESMAKASGGLNRGNVRAMHSNVAAGMVKEISCDDAAKTIMFGIAVTNGQEFKNCLMGLYTGISPGGQMRKWADGTHTRFEAKPEELSLVDRPSNPNATFLMRKAGGLEEVCLFAAPDDVPAIVEAMAKAAGPGELAGMIMAFPVATIVRLFGNDGERAPVDVMEKRAVSATDRHELASKGEAMPDGSFPISSKADLENAIQAIGRAKDEPATKAFIIGRAKALGATDVLPADWTSGDSTMKKGLDQVSCIARIVQDIGWLAREVADESAYEGDGSKVPAQLATWLRDGVTILTAMASEESTELVQAVAAQVAQLPVLEAASAALDAIEDQAALDDGDVMVKSAAWPRVVSMAAELASARETMRKFAGDLATVEAARDTLQARVAQLEALPKPGGPALRAVAKEADRPTPTAAATARAAVDAMPPGYERAVAEARLAMQPR